MSAPTCFCPNCWVETGPHDPVCPSCGFRMAAFDALGYEGKLLLALKHPIPDNRLLAIQLLGELKSRSAVSVFATAVDEEQDPYVLGAIARALAVVGSNAARAILARLRSHPSVIVRSAAEDAYRALTEGDSEGHQSRFLSYG
jgi:HEAT repeat protein